MVSGAVEMQDKILTEDPFQEFFISIVNAIVILGALIIPAYILRTIRFGVDPFSVIQWVIYPSLVGLIIFRKRIPFRISVWLFIWAVWLFGATGLFRWGILGCAEIILTGMLIITAISQDKKMVLLLTALNLLLYVLVGSLVLKGVYRPQVDALAYSTSLQGWIITGLTFFVFIGTLAERTGWMFREIAVISSRLETNNERYFEEIKLRKETQKTLEEMTTRKEALLQNVHHQVKSNLQIISGIIDVQAATSADPDVKRITRTTEGRIQSMASIHEILYQSGDLSRMNLKTLLESLCLNIEGAFGLKEKNIVLTTSLEEVEVKIENAVPFALIINEVINNSIIHAFPEPAAGGEIKVSLSMIDGREIRAEVRDNGRGAGGILDRRDTSSMGYDLINIITEEMGAHFEVHDDNGTVFTIRLRI